MKTSLPLAKTASFIALIGVLAFAGLTVGCQPKTTTPETAGNYVDDTAITAKVKASLLGDVAVKSFEIKVETVKGVVQLSGFVDSAEHVARAGEVAARIHGVKEVQNDLVVK